MILNYIPYESFPLRTFAYDEARWFVLPDLCCVLGIAVKEVAARLEEYEYMAVNLRTATGRQEVVVAVNTSGLHNILSSGRRRSRTREFKRWMVTRVLPLMRPGDENVLRPSQDEIVLLPPSAKECLTSTTEIADATGFAPMTLGRLASHLKTPRHGEFRPAVAHYSHIPIEQWWWNEEGRHAVLKEFYWSDVWPRYWSRVCVN